MHYCRIDVFLSLSVTLGVAAEACSRKHVIRRAIYSGEIHSWYGIIALVVLIRSELQTAVWSASTISTERVVVW